MLLTNLQAKLVEREKTGWEPSFYTIIPDGLQWGTTTDTAKYPYIVDTGTTMMHIPPRQLTRFTFLMVTNSSKSPG